jgi:small subunit ribosomal protein S18
MAKRKKSFKRNLKNTAPKECWFCVEKKEPAYSDVSNLTRFVTERGKIIGRTRSGLCGKHQKRLTLEVKHARHLALIAHTVVI